MRRFSLQLARHQYPPPQVILVLPPSVLGLPDRPMADYSPALARPRRP